VRPVGLVGSVALTIALALPLTIAGLAVAAGPADARTPTPLQVAKAALLTLADMPAGWVATSVGTGATHTAPLSAPMAKCIHVSPSVATVKPLKVSSPDFTGPDRLDAVEDSASVYATAAQAAAAFKAMANRKTPPCMGVLGSAPLQTSIEAQAGRGAVVDSISIGPLPAGSVAPGQTGFMVRIPLTVKGKDVTIESTQIDFVKGKVLQQLTFNGNGGPFTPLEQVHLLLIATGHP
jgi:hypothetical protein